MSGRGKRLWPPGLGVDEAYREVLQLLQRCGTHGLSVAPTVPLLFKCYVVDGVWPVETGREISRHLRFGYGNNPTADRAKPSVARLLSVALRAHWFMAPQAKVPYEPSATAVPDLAQPGAQRHVLTYPLDVPSVTGGPVHQRTLVVAEWDLALSAHREPRIARGNQFPVVLRPDPFTWINRKQWVRMKEQAGTLPWFEPQTSPARQRLLRDVNACARVNEFIYGTILDYPYQMREDIAATGAMWAQGLRKWFMPHGFDIDAVKAYLDRIRDLSPADRKNERWWMMRDERHNTRKNDKKSAPSEASAPT